MILTITLRDVTKDAIKATKREGRYEIAHYDCFEFLTDKKTRESDDSSLSPSKCLRIGEIERDKEMTSFRLQR